MTRQESRALHKRAWQVLLLGFGVCGNASPGTLAVGPDQTMAGIRVGDSITRARHLFPGLAETGGKGVWTVSIGRNCRLEVVELDSEAPRGIQVVTLQRLRPEDLQDDPDCNILKTGAGLPFGASLSDIERVYKGVSLSLMEPGKEPELFRADNGPDCLKARSPMLRSMFIYWSTRSRRIQLLSVEGSRRSCEEYRDSKRDGGP